MNEKTSFLHSIFGVKQALKVICTARFRIVLSLILVVFCIPVVSSGTSAPLGLAGYSIRILAVDHKNPGIIYAGVAGGVVAKSTDGGASWTLTSTGVTTKAITALAIHPTNTNILYASGFSVGFKVIRSADGGNTWTNPFEKCGTYLYECSAIGFPGLAVDTPDVVYAGTRNGGAGMYKSLDGGKNWIVTNMPGGIIVQDIAIDPGTSSTIYVAASNGSVYKSIDSGINWAIKNNGLPGTSSNLNDLAINPNNPSIIYVGGAIGIYKSEDGGENWTAKNNGLTSSFVDSIAIDPDVPSIMYVGTVYKGYIYKTTDGGENWTLINAGLEERMIQHVSIDPQRPSTVYAGTDNGIYRSDDSGATWVHPPPELPPPLPKTESSANFESSCSGGHPINTHTGELYEQYSPDINLGGPMSLRFSRYYASGLKNSNIVGRMGDNWRHNFEWTLQDNDTTLYIVDNRGRLINFNQNGTAWELTGKTDLVFQLTESVGVFTLFDPRDKRLYKFNAAGQLTGIEDGRGNIHTLSYDVNGLLTQVADGMDRTLIFNYNENDHLISVGDGTRTVGFVYTASDLTTVTYLMGNATTYAYTDGGLMSATTRPAGNTPYTQTFHGDGKVATQADSYGNTLSFDYAASDTTMTDALGHTKVHTHTATGELSNIQDQTGKNISVGSDSTGRRNSISDRLGDVTTYDYHAANGDMSSVTNTAGGTKVFDYTARDVSGITFYDIARITHADNTIDSFSYDGSGNPISHNDRAGYLSAYAYNTFGQLLTATNPAGGVTTNTYNSDGTQATGADPAGNETNYTYDSLKRLSNITYADSSTIQFTFNDNNNLLAVTNENSHITSMGYDANNNLSAITTPLGTTTIFSYDGNDRLLSVTDPLGHSASMTYDELGRVKSVTGKNNNVTIYGYDAIGRLTSTTDPGGNVWTRTYDAEGIIESRTNPLANTTTYSSDAMGRITRITSPRGNTSSLTYDVMGCVTSAIDPLGSTTNFTRDSRGLLTGVSMPGGKVSAGYTRNELGRITAITDPNGNVWQRSYDNMGRLTATGDPLGNASSIAYDNRNRPALITYTGLGTLNMGYDSVGNLTQRAFSDGTTITNSYDANNRMIAASGTTLDYDANNRVTGTNGITLSRDAGGRITSMTLTNGKEITYSYDANNRLTQVKDWAGGVSNFTYDAAGRLISVSRPNGIETTNTYDNDNRLTGITEGTVSNISLTRDAKGQITGATRDVPQVASASGLTSQFRTFDAASQVADYTYDSLGRLIADESRTYDWDLASRLKSFTQDAATTSFSYDAAGRQLSRTSGGMTREYVWNYALGLSSVSVVRQGGGDIRYYVHSPNGMLLYSIEASDNSRRYYHYDEKGNTSFVSDDSGSVIGSYAYSPFGRLISSSGDLDNPFTWQGKHGVMDEGNDLYYIRARYYDSATGRFISRDPKRSINPKSVNPYQYAWNNPFRFVDLSGMDTADMIANHPARFDGLTSAGLHFEGFARVFGPYKEAFPSASNHFGHYYTYQNPYVESVLSDIESFDIVQAVAGGGPPDNKRGQDLKTKCKSEGGRDLSLSILGQPAKDFLEIVKQFMIMEFIVKVVNKYGLRGSSRTTVTDKDILELPPRPKIEPGPFGSMFNSVLDTIYEQARENPDEVRALFGLPSTTGGGGDNQIESAVPELVPIVVLC